MASLLGGRGWGLERSLSGLLSSLPSPECCQAKQEETPGVIFLHSETRRAFSPASFRFAAGSRVRRPSPSPGSEHGGLGGRGREGSR